MRKSILIGIAATVVLAAGVTTRARQRDTPPVVVASPIVINDFIEVGDRHLFQRSRIEHLQFFPDGATQVFLIGRDRPIILSPEEAKALRAAITPSHGDRAPDLDPAPLPQPGRGRPFPAEPPLRRDSPFRLLPDPDA